MPEPGERIGPYRLVSQLATGAMGEVWRARDERLDRYVALKILPADFAGDRERRARMLREARAAAAIRHANVVTLFDIVAHAGDDVLVMFPGEADAIGVYATTLVAAGELDRAVAAAEEALRLSEGEDTLAGLAEVFATAQGMTLTTAAAEPT